MKEKCSLCGKSGVELNYFGEDYEPGQVKIGYKKVCRECFLNLQKEGVKTMGELANFAKRNSQFITLSDGESIEAAYKGFKQGINTLDPTKEVIIYQFETEFGTKAFKSGSCALARLFDNVAKDTEIRLTRSGEGNQTKYKLEIKEGDDWKVATKAEDE